MDNKKIERLVAQVTLHYPARMDKGGRDAVARWLLGVARDLQEHGHMMSKRYTARYFVHPNWCGFNTGENLK